MLNKPIERILYDKDGKVRGVVSEGQEAYCKQLIADPSYFVGSDKVKKTGQVARCIALLSHPIANTNDESAQIIIPAAAVKGRKRDIYILQVSHHLAVASKGWYIAVISADVEGKEIPDSKADAKGCEAGVRAQLAPALPLLGEVKQFFFWVSNNYEAANDSKKDGIFISSSYDATSHWESSAAEVVAFAETLTGKKMDLNQTLTADSLQDPDAVLGAEGGEEEKESSSAADGGAEKAAEKAAAEKAAAELAAVTAALESAALEGDKPTSSSSSSTS
jgi:Rab GDP dissociation inhibitor